MLSSIQKRINFWKWFASIWTASALFLVVACQEQAKSSEAKTGLNDAVYTVVDEVATPEGGITAYYAYISNHLKYPAQARRTGVEGKVFLEFVIQKDGSVTDVTVREGIGAGCDSAAVEVITRAPKWTPAKNDGEIVAMKMVLPIIFKLE